MPARPQRHDPHQQRTHQPHGHEPYDDVAEQAEEAAASLRQRPEPPAEIHHRRRAPEPLLLKCDKRGLRGVVAVEHLGEPVAILDGLTAPLPEVRRTGMHGIAYATHAVGVSLLRS